MAKNKTTQTDADVREFIQSYVNADAKKVDSFTLIQLMREWSGFEPKMWGSSIIGFGEYQYKYDSGHEGNAPIIGFSPRKAAISLYVYSETECSAVLLKNLGKFKMGKACIYIKKLTDIDTSVLQKLCVDSINYIGKHHECACHKK